jgi:hypothetical protein
MAEILVSDRSGPSNRPAQTQNSSPHTPPLLKAADGSEPDHISSGFREGGEEVRQGRFPAAEHTYSTRR